MLLTLGLSTWLVSGSPGAGTPTNRCLALALAPRARSSRAATMGRLKWIAVLLGGQSGTKYAQVGDLQYAECLHARMLE